MAGSAAGTSAVQIWTLFVASLAVVATLVAYLLRRTGKGQVDATKLAAAASKQSADAAQVSTAASARSAKAAERGVEVNEATAAAAARRAEHEENTRTFRWAAELAVALETEQAKLGVAQIAALAELLAPDDELQPLIDAALAAVVKEPVQEVEEIAQSGNAKPAAYIVIGSPTVTYTPDDIPSESSTTEGGDG